MVQVARSVSGAPVVPVVAVAAAVLLLGGMMTAPSSAHTTVHVEQYTIEVGWGIEPPIVGIRNDLVFKITEPGSSEGSYHGVANAFKAMQPTAMFGGVTKQIDMNSDPRPGYYFSPVIPTKTGSYSVELAGDLYGTAVDVKIPIEDVMPTAVLDFPPTSSGDSGGADIAALKNAVSSLQQDILKLKMSGGDNDGSSSGGEGGNGGSAGASYDIAIFGLSIAAAAIILAVIALVKRR